MTTTVRLRRGAWPGGLVALACLTGCETSIDERDIKRIQTGEVKALMDRAQGGEPDALLIIDPRLPERFAQGRLPGARNMALPPVEAGGNDPGLTPYANLVVAAENPGDPLGSAMTKRLLALKYKGVRLYAGGLDEWKRAGLPVETGDAP